MSLNQVGKTLTWVDIRAVMMNLPPTSHFMRLVNPQKAKHAEWTTPTNLLLGAIYDLTFRIPFVQSGEPLDDYKGIIQNVLTMKEQPEEVKPKREKKTPEQIRAQLGLPQKS